MKRILLAGAALAATTLGSQAADLGYAPAPVDVWSGFFVGIQGGYGWGDADYAFLDTGTFDEANPSSFEIEGGLGGLYYGRNWQSGSFVYGLEGSISFGDLSDGTT